MLNLTVSWRLTLVIALTVPLVAFQNQNSSENPLPGRGGVEVESLEDSTHSRSAGVGLFPRSENLLKSPLVQRGTLFSSNLVPQRGMRGSPAKSVARKPAGIRFSDIAVQAKLDFLHVSGSLDKKYLPETFSGGVAWIDYNLDGWPDLYLVNGGSWEDLLAGTRTVSNALFKNNRDGTFSNVTRQAGVAGHSWGMGATVADYDNDGWPDLYLCNYGPNQLYRNNHDGTFSDVTEKAKVGDAHWSSSAGFADYDGDGWLDLYVANYVDFNHQTPPAPDCQYRGIKVHCGPKGMIAAPDVLYHNNGNGTFTDVTRAAGMSVLPAYGLGVLWGDYDNDGDPDLYVANDSVANFLFENQGNGTFREVAVIAGVAYNEDGQPQAGMGLAMGDYDHDGFFDYFQTNFSGDYNALRRYLGKGVFRDVSYSSGVALPSWQLLGWGTGFFDYDNDGWEDLFVSNGHVYPQVDQHPIEIAFAEPKLVHRNLGNGKFADVSAQLGSALTSPWSGRGAAFADFDNDGDVDVAVNNLGTRPSLFRNEGGHRSGNWLLIELVSKTGNRGATGARVSVEAEQTRQMQEVTAGNSYQSSNDWRLHFGLGTSSVAKAVVVRWPDRQLERFEGVPANHIYFLKQGGQLAVTKSKRD